jgi:hypothetical protein
MRTAYLPMIALVIHPWSSAFGQFGTEHIVTSTSNTIWTFRVADIDGDGHNDVIGHRLDYGYLAIYLNDGTGGFGPATFIDPPGWMHYYFATGDLDSDGDVDIVYSRFDDYSQVLWLENDGTGQFGDPILIDSTAWIDPVLVDVDGDGDIDIITGHGSAIVVLENDGAQAFSHTEYSPSLTSAFCGQANVGLPGDFHLADMNGDGHMDLLFGDLQCLGAYWMEGLSDSSFGAGHFIMNLNADIWMQPTDLDGDGDTDLAIADGDRFILFENDGTGSLTPADTAPNASTHTSCFVLRDCDGDGDLDFVRSTGAVIDWLERTGPLSIGEYHNGVPIPPGFTYLLQADILGSEAPELFYSNRVNTVAYFGDGGAIGSGIDDLNNDQPHDVMVLSADGAMVRIASPMVSGVHVFDTNGAEVRINVEQTGLNSVIRMPGVSPGLYFVTYTAGSRRGSMRLLLTN